MSAGPLHLLNLSKENIKTEAKQSWNNTDNKFRAWHSSPHTCSLRFHVSETFMVHKGQEQKNWVSLVYPSGERLFARISVGPVIDPNQDLPYRSFSNRSWAKGSPSPACSACGLTPSLEMVCNYFSLPQVFAIPDYPFLCPKSPVLL